MSSLWCQIKQILWQQVFFHLSVGWCICLLDIKSRLGFQWYPISNLCSLLSRLKLQLIFECNSSAVLQDVQHLPAGGDGAQTSSQIKSIHFHVYCWIETTAPEFDTQVSATPIVCWWCVDQLVAMPNGQQKWDKQLAAMPIICWHDDYCVISNFYKSMVSQKQSTTKKLSWLVNCPSSTMSLSSSSWRLATMSLVG